MSIEKTAPEQSVTVETIYRECYQHLNTTSEAIKRAEGELTDILSNEVSPELAERILNAANLYAAAVQERAFVGGWRVAVGLTPDK